MNKIITASLFTILISSLAYSENLSTTAAKSLVKEKGGNRTLEEIVVTAQRREESLSDVPIAVSAFGESEIEDRSMTSFSDVAPSTPGFIFAQSFAGSSPTVRGIGSDRYLASNESGVAMYLDDIYLGRPYLPQAALTSLERIEVLKGPQGTLYGRNASGGALKLVSKRPSNELEGSIGVQYGSFEQKVIKGTASGPVLQNLQARVSGFYEDRDGYIENRTLNEYVNAHEVKSGRLALAFQPTDNLSLDFNIDTTWQYDTGPVGQATTGLTFGLAGNGNLDVPAFSPYTDLLAAVAGENPELLQSVRDVFANTTGGRVSYDPDYVYQDAPTSTEIDSQGAALTIISAYHDIDIKLITGYRDSERIFNYDFDITDFPGATLELYTQAEQYSGEFQLSSTAEMPVVGGDVFWLGGLYHYAEDTNENLDSGFVNSGIGAFQSSIGALTPAQLLPLFQNEGVAQVIFRTDLLETRSNAAFFDVEWSALEWMRLHLGGRYTEDNKKQINTVITPVVGQGCEKNTQSNTWSASTFKTGIDFPIQDNLLYISYTQGFKSGGFNPSNCKKSPYDPEYVDSYEVGLKATWLDNTLQANIAAFQYAYTDLQFEVSNGLSTNVLNAGEAEVNGAEIELKYLLNDSIKIDASAAWLDARYIQLTDRDQYGLAGLSSFIGENQAPEEDLSGNRLNKSPKWSGSAGVERYIDLKDYGELTARLEWSYTGSMYFDQFNHGFSESEAYDLWNAYLNLDTLSQSLRISIFGKNLTDEVYVNSRFTTSALVGGPTTWFGMPRTYGVAINFNF